MSADKFPRVFCIDFHEEKRHAWLVAMQAKMRRIECIKKLLLFGVAVVGLCCISQRDFEDQLSIQAERDAYTKALANCNSAPVLLTANK